eukprot:6018188-Pyramimonas_sp.AAC.1
MLKPPEERVQTVSLALEGGQKKWETRLRIIFPAHRFNRSGINLAVLGYAVVEPQAATQYQEGFVGLTGLILLGIFWRLEMQEWRGQTCAWLLWALLPPARPRRRNRLGKGPSWSALGAFSLGSGETTLTNERQHREGPNVILHDALEEAGAEVLDIPGTRA